MKPRLSYYPALLRLDGRRCLVVGGGKVAWRKVASLREAGARVRVVSPEFCAPLARMKGVTRHRRPYRSADLRGAMVVICATDDEAVNRQVARDAMKAGLLVNVVDRPERCSFIVPAALRRGRLTITISTDGASPALAAQIRRGLEQRFGSEYARLLEALSAARAEAMRRIADPRARRRVLQQLVSPRFMRLAKRSSTGIVRQAMIALVREQATPPK